MAASSLLKILEKVRACRVCAGKLPNEPKPILIASERARVLIIGQAPGRVAHGTGVPWNDVSGRRLREWLGLTDDEFYDSSKVALVPMGFCFPGKGRGGDMPPRPECAPLWHPEILPRLKAVKLTIYIGRYAFERHLSEAGWANLTEAVRDAERLLPDRVQLPHPSPRNGAWVARNAWFEKKVLPAVRLRIREVIG